MTKRFFISGFLAAFLSTILFIVTALFASGTLAGPTASVDSSKAIQDKGATKGTDNTFGTWEDIAPLPTISVDEFYPCDPAPCTPQGVNVPARIKRATAAAYPPNGKIYLFGGRHGLDSNEDFPLRWIFEYDPTANTWTRKNALLDGTETRERYVANMASATLTDTNGMRIYVVGGNSIDAIPSASVRIYDPNADALTTLTAPDNWPASPARVPGGSAVYNNKLYLVGGFSSLGAGSTYSGTWRFDPMAAVGSKWTQLANLNVSRAYMATSVVDGKLYAVGGDTWDSVNRLLVPNDTVEMMDLTQPVPTWTTLANLPTPRGDLRAWGYDTGTNYEVSGRVMVAGGPYEVPDGLAYVFDPGVNAWAEAPIMLHPTRNFASAQLNGYLYALGGYDYSGGQPNGANFAQRYDARTPLGSPTPTVTGTPPTHTNTPTRTNTPTITPTVCSSTYTYATSTATIFPAANDIGNHDDDLVTNVALPFSYSFFGQAFTSVNLSSNGNAQFTGADDAYDNECLYSPVLYQFSAAPYWDDQRTDRTGGGIFTSTTGIAPNRTFYIEWRTVYYDTEQPANYEMVLHENTHTIEFIYGDVPLGNSSSTVGLQKNFDTYVQYACQGTGGAVTSGLRIVWTELLCATSTPVPATSTPTRTNTPIPTSTTILTNTPTTGAGTPSSTPGQPTSTPTACTLEFADVLPGNTFYATIHCLACQGIINGYPCGGDGEPCNGSNQPYFRPSNNITRGQLAKVVSQSAGYTDPVTTQAFEDVDPGTTFYDYVGRLALHDVMGGYPCGVDPNEPCGNGNLPYFRPGANATRGQLTKIVSNAAGFSDPDPATFTFTDVPPGSTFHLYVERLLINRPGAIGGYTCGGAGEPCDDQNRPYFRPSNTLTRGQTSKIVTNTFFPDCAVGLPPANPNVTSSPASRIGPYGTHFSFTTGGFTPYEQVGFYLAAPDGSIYGVLNQVATDGQGNLLQSVSIGTLPSIPPLIWTITFQGITSHITRTEHFAITP